jgi:hypothetical protein
LRPCVSEIDCEAKKAYFDIPDLNNCMAEHVTRSDHGCIIGTLFEMNVRGEPIEVGFGDPIAQDIGSLAIGFVKLMIAKCHIHPLVTPPYVRIALEHVHDVDHLAAVIGVAEQRRRDHISCMQEEQVIAPLKLPP